MQALAISVALSCATAAVAQDVEFERAAVLASYGASVPNARAIPLNTPTPVPTTAIDTILRVHFVVSGSAPPSGYEVRVLSGGRTWTSTDQQESEGDLWLGDLMDPAPRVEVRASPGTNVSVSVDRVSVARPPATPEATFGPDEKEPIAQQSDRVKGWAKGVARLRFTADNGFSYFCSGFLISKSLLLTNQHCIGTDSERKSAQVDFDHDDVPGVQKVTVGLDRLGPSNASLDYSIVHLSEVQHGRTPLPLHAMGAESAHNDGKALLVIQHPGGKKKMVSLVGCRVSGLHLPGRAVVGVDPTPLSDFGHECDTLGGSSGAPIQIMPAGDVVGLHHLGFRKSDGIRVNRGVDIGLVLADAVKQDPALAAELGQ